MTPSFFFAEAHGSFVFFIRSDEMVGVDETHLDTADLHVADYQPRTIKMCVRAFKNINSNQPEKKIIYHESTTLDLALPAPSWRDLSYDSFQGHQTKIRFMVNVTRETNDFFPLEFKEYLRFDVAVVGEIREGNGEQSLTSSTWIHPSSAYAASKIILGPLTNDPIHFVFSTVFQISP